jgi:hypothetical protein
MTGDHQVQSHHGALWTLLQDMRIEGPGAQRRFEEALAEEKGWSLGHAERVTREYRRFLYLAASAPGEVTPSRSVDAAWHLHLTYSRHYWEELCGRILGRPLHHNPSRGEPGEGARFLGQYAETLALYRRTFGTTPPRDIWPPLPVTEAPPEPEEEDKRGSRLVVALLCAPFMIIFGAVSAGNAGTLFAAACAAVTICAFIWFGPRTPMGSAQSRPARAACGSGGGSCGGTLAIPSDSGGASCGGGCGGD